MRALSKCLGISSNIGSIVATMAFGALVFSVRSLSWQCEQSTPSDAAYTLIAIARFGLRSNSLV